MFDLSDGIPSGYLTSTLEKASFFLAEGEKWKAFQGRSGWGICTGSRTPHVCLVSEYAPGVTVPAMTVVLSCSSRRNSVCPQFISFQSHNILLAAERDWQCHPSLRLTSLTHSPACLPTPSLYAGEWTSISAAWLICQFPSAKVLWGFFLLFFFHGDRSQISLFFLHTLPGFKGCGHVLQSRLLFHWQEWGVHRSALAPMTLCSEWKLQRCWRVKIKW